MEASKFAAKLPEDEPSEDADAWLDEIEEPEEAPAEMHEYFDHIARRRTMLCS